MPGSTQEQDDDYKRMIAQLIGDLVTASKEVASYATNDVKRSRREIVAFRKLWRKLFTDNPTDTEIEEALF